MAGHTASNQLYTNGKGMSFFAAMSLVERQAQQEIAVVTQHDPDGDHSDYFSFLEGMMADAKSAWAIYRQAEDEFLRQLKVRQAEALTAFRAQQQVELTAALRVVADRLRATEGEILPRIADCLIEDDYSELAL